MRFILATAVLAGLVAWGAARAQEDETEEVRAAKAIQVACVANGEDAQVCACGVGLAYAQLDPKIFKLAPQIQPLLDRKDKTSAMGELIAIASANDLGLEDLTAAYETIKDNRKTMKQICKPLSSKAS